MGWILGLLAVATAWLGWQSVGSAAARARAGYLDACAPLFTGVIKGVAETGFARLSGLYRGQTFDVQVVPDTLSVRKLPVLWLLVTLPEQLPLRGTFDVMLRATGLETFSGFARLGDQIEVPSGFPAECSIRTDAPEGLPDSAVIKRYMAGLDKARLKEVVVAPTGVRVVWLAEEADRGGYLLFRNAEMGSVALPPTVLQPLMDGLCDLWAGAMADALPKKRMLG
jgi:hypothetical protein